MIEPVQGSPDDWRDVCLGDLLKFSNGINAEKSAYGSGIPFANVTEVIANESLREREIPGRIKTSKKLQGRYEVHRGDVLFNRTSETQEEVGLASVYVGDSPILFGGFVFRGRPLTDALCLSYSKYALRAAHVRDQITCRGQGGIRANIGQRDLRSVVVTLPTVQEQRVIAEALDDVTSQTKLLERLIAKKQAIKLGMMQQLLTGRTRLPGFNGGWEQGRVAERGDVLAGKALNVSGAGTLRPYLRTKNVLDGRIDLRDVLWMPMTGAEFERFHLERGDVLLNEGQSLELVGRCSIYNNEFRAPCTMQNQLLRFRAHMGTSPEFAAHLFRYCQRTGVFAGIATQTTSVAHLGSSRFSNLRLLWPTDRLEQAAIAEALSDMDTEVAALETRLKKARAVKQGMMQQLLTGKTRLPVQGGTS